MSQTTFDAQVNTYNCIAISYANWNTAHDASNGTGQNSTYWIGSNFRESMYGIHRPFIIFDASSIPDSNDITKVELKFNVGVFPYSDDNSGKREVGVVQTTQPSTSNVTNADFDLCGVVDNPTEGAPRLSITTTGWKTFTLNSTGRGWISKTGYTKLGIRFWLDMDDIAPTDGVQEMLCSSSDYQLIVTHWGTDRYWVGGTGNWNDTDNWSDSSGGDGGAPVPTASNDVYFDANSFDAASQVVTLNNNVYCNSMTWTGATNTPTIAGDCHIFVYNAFVPIAAMVWNQSGHLYLKSTDTETLTTNGLNFNCNFVFDGVGSAWTFQDALTCKEIYLVNGTLDTNDQTVNCVIFFSSYSTIRVLTLGASTINCSGDWNITDDTNLTLNANTSTLNLTGDNTDFQAGNKVYNDVVLSGNNITIYRSNTFADLQFTANKQVNLTSGQTQTVTTCAPTGSAGNLITIHATVAGTAAIISDSAGTNTCNYLSVKDITVAGGATFNPGDNSIDEGGNTGWTNPWTNKSDAYSSNNSYATHTSPSGKLYIKLSKDAGSTWSETILVTHTGAEDSQTFGDGATEKWGTVWLGADVADANFRVRVYANDDDSFNYADFYDYHFEDAPDSLGAAVKINGIEIVSEGKWNGTTFYLDHLKVKVYSGTSSQEVKDLAIVGDTTNRRPAFYDDTNSVWKPMATRDDVTALSLTYYFNNTASDIGGIYYEMLDNETGEAKSTLSTAGLGAGDDQALVNFVTLSGKPGIDKVEAGLYRIHCHAERTVGTRSVAVYAKLYKRILAGTETLLGTSETSSAVISETHLNLHMVLADSVDLLTTDRLVVKFFANIGSSGSATTVALYQEGTIDCGIAINVSSSSLNNIFLRQDYGGWTPITSTFTYASATTINISTGGASKYSIGDKLRFQNNDSGTYLYAYIITVADTLLTVLGDTVPNATLTDEYYSKVENPQGFPHYFAFTPTWTSPGGNPAIGNGTFTANFKISGKEVTVQYHIIIGGTTNVGAAYWVIGYPTIVSGSPHPVSIWNSYCAGAYTVGAIELLSSTTFICNWTASANYVGKDQPGVWVATNWLRINVTFRVA